MRVIAGTAKGRRLVTPPRDAPIRPVEDRVKESLYNILFSVIDLRVLDCFAGTGALGIEALSRGAAHATFIEQAPQAIALIHENLARCQVADRATVLRGAATRTLQRLGQLQMQFDIIFLDPPYGQDLVAPNLTIIAEQQLLVPTGQILIEHARQDQFAIPAALVPSDQRRFGQTLVTFLKLG